LSKFINDFYYGNLSPQSSGIMKQSRFKQLMTSLVEKEELLTNELEGKHREIFLEYVDLWGEVNALSCADSFANGFRMGAGFAYDAFASPEHNS